MQGTAPWAREGASQMCKFNSLAAAQSFANRTVKASAVILGDDCLFWVVSLAEMERLLRQGYELA
jgi:hypothetical protein